MSNYQLDNLGWYQFERLCQALLRAQYGAALEAWGGGGDWGRDAYSDGPLHYPDANRTAAGPFVFQVKYISEANAPGARFRSALRSAVTGELRRISGRISDGTWSPARYYTLLTNAPVGAPLRQELRKMISEALPNTSILINGASDIAAALDATPAIRLAYPQILGLRDLRALLEQAVAKDVVTRSNVVVEALGKLACVYVPTEAYNKAISLLELRGFAVLTGPPEMGKTATARMLSLARLSMGWQAYDCTSPSELFRMFDHGVPQVFVADDAFGSTEYRPELASEWAMQLDKVIGICDKRHWVIWTSRPGPLKEGLERLHLQGAASNFPSPGQVQVDASRLSVAEKAQILYRHSKAASLDSEAKTLVRQQAASIVSSPHFTPLRIQRLVGHQLPEIMSSRKEERLTRLRATLASGIQEPTSAMRTSFNALPEEPRSLLISMLDSGGGRQEMKALDAAFKRFLGRTPEVSADRLVDLLDEHFLKRDPTYD